MCARVRKDPEDRGSVRRGGSGARAIRAWAVMKECQGFARSILDGYIYVVYRQPVLALQPRTVHSTAHARARESKAPNCFGKPDRVIIYANNIAETVGSRPGDVKGTRMDGGPP